jgi:RimJ/RimL family protein N-acetyltransferase
VTDLPLGPIVDATPALKPERVQLVGRHITLAPLAPAHAAELYGPAHGAEREPLWAYMGDGPYADETAFGAAIAAKAASLDPLYFAALDKRGRPDGYLSLMRIEPANRVIEIGNILFTPALQRTRAATEAVFLIARYVFDTLGYRRLEWKCNALNAPSRRAALRFGFGFEGIFAQHMIVKGRSRDTAWYAMLDRDWPARKAAFERWLAPGNFDPDGRQREALSRLNESGNRG